MLTFTEIRSALTGSFLLARKGTSGLQYFDVSIDGFWRSFLVIVLAAPLYLLFTWKEFLILGELEPQSADLEFGAGFVATKFALMVVDWLVFPIAMIFISRQMSLWPKYIPFIAIYNWSSLFLMLVLSPIAILFVIGFISAQAATSLNLLATMFVLYYRWSVAKTVLETTMNTAALIVALELILSLMVHGLFFRFTGF